MSAEDGTYAPKSPDLSFLAGNEPEPPQKTPNLWTPDSYVLPQGQPNHHHHASPHLAPPPPPSAPAGYQHQPLPQQAPVAAAGFPYHHPSAQSPPPHLQHQAQPYPSPSYPASPPEVQQTPYGVPHPAYHPPPYYSSYPQTNPYQPQQLQLAQASGYPHPPPLSASPPSVMPPRKAPPPAKQPEIMESPVKTKFPTARIKRIMQADEEVGKVAQQTPIAVGKALELFMVQIVTKSAEVAKDKNSKRITAQMLKQAVESTNEWDFLQEIVAKVSDKEDASKSGGRAKAESESDDEAEGGEVKKKARVGRKKKTAA